jgi:superfamily I DNA/RNA helicase
MPDIIRAADMKHAGFEHDPEGEKVVQMALEALQRRASPRYCAVLLDEAQDFGTDALRFVVGLLEPGCDDLVIVADAAQNIFRWEFSWRQAGIQAQGRMRILRKNYRNTKESLEFASRFLLASAVLCPDEVPDPEDENAVILPESSARNGPRPLLHVVEDLWAEITRVIEQVNTWVVPAAQPRTLAVLYASSRNNGMERARALYDGLRAAGVRVFWLNDPHDRDARERLAETAAPVILSTIHSAKAWSSLM